MSLLISLVFAGAAYMAALALGEIRQRQVARARALGMQAGRASLGEVGGELRRARAEKLSLLLPEGLRAGLQAKISQADLAMSPGLLAFDILAYAVGGLALALLLDFGVYAPVCALMAGLLPFMRVNDLGQRRHMALRRDLPDALDLLCTCVEAGLGFDQALARVASRLKPGFLKKELEACVASFSVGAPRREALRELDRRAGLEDLSQVVSALLQADKRGVPLGPALRAQSSQLRVLRGLRGEKGRGRGAPEDAFSADGLHPAGGLYRSLRPHHPQMAIRGLLMQAVSIGVRHGRVLAARAWATEDVGERVQGWLGKTRSEDGDGLLLTPASAVHSIGMKISIDVVFLDHEMRITKITRHLAPGRFAFGSFRNMAMPWRSQVLELPAGASEGLARGEHLEMIRRKA